LLSFSAIKEAVKTSVAIKHFGGRGELARALGLTTPAVYQKQWKVRPPYLRQLQIEHITGGALKADPPPAPRKKTRKQARAD
jgi:DNA-binding transcriptional regulator YdaS (Cro superfamily)